jgi:D-alanine-D-alanine ligase
VDFFLERRTDRVLVNEINTLPGFTAISMYPKLWEASGMPLPRLLDELVRLALGRHERRGRLLTKPPSELA